MDWNCDLLAAGVKSEENKNNPLHITGIAAMRVMISFCALPHPKQAFLALPL